MDRESSTHDCVYVWSRGRLRGNECGRPVIAETDFCGQCRCKVFFIQQQNPLFRCAVKEWNLTKIKDDIYFTPKYAFMLQYDDNFHLQSVCIRLEDRTEDDTSIYREPTEKEKQTACELGILVN